MTDEKKPPQGVAGVVCAGVDVMSDRLEVGVYAFTPDAKRVAHLVLWGDPGQDACWQQLHALLCGLSGLQAAGVDSGGHHTQQVLRFAHASGQKGSGAAHKVFASKTRSIRGVPCGISTVRVGVFHQGKLLDDSIELLLINMKTNNDPNDVFTLAQAVYSWDASDRTAMKAMDLQPPQAVLAAVRTQ